MKIPESNKKLKPRQEALVKQLELIIKKLKEAKCGLWFDRESVENFSPCIVVTNEEDLDGMYFSYDDYDEGTPDNEVSLKSFSDWLNNSRHIDENIFVIPDLTDGIKIYMDK